MNSKTVTKALNILDEFTVEQPLWGLRELARQVEMNHTIVHRILVSLEEKSYVYCDPDTRKYQLGIKFIELNNVVEEHLNIPNLIHPIMKRIALETEESVVFTLLDEDEGVFMKIVESEQKVRLSESVGKRSPLYIGASHKVILANLPEETQNRIIDSAVHKKVKYVGSKEALIKQLREIKENGWCFSEGETFDDVVACSIPVFDKNNNILGSLSIAGPKYRLPREKIEKLLPFLFENSEYLNDVLNKVNFPSRRRFLEKKFA